MSERLNNVTNFLFDFKVTLNKVYLSLANRFWIQFTIKDRASNIPLPFYSQNNISRDGGACGKQTNKKVSVVVP